MKSSYIIRIASAESYTALLFFLEECVIQCFLFLLIWYQTKEYWDKICVLKYHQSTAVMPALPLPSTHQCVSDAAYRKSFQREEYLVLGAFPEIINIGNNYDI